MTADLLKRRRPGFKELLRGFRPSASPFVPLLLIIAAMSFACSTPSLTSTADRDAKFLAGTMSVIEDVPFYPQEDYQCGPASLASVLHYWGVAATPEGIARDIYSESARGTLNIDMLLYARARGLEASQYSGGLRDLKERIDSGHPLIVLVDYGFSLYQVNHFMVVIGYGDDGIVAHSGKEKQKFIRADDFLRSWARAKYWTLLIRKQ